MMYKDVKAQVRQKIADIVENAIPGIVVAIHLPLSGRRSKLATVEQLTKAAEEIVREIRTRRCPCDEQDTP